MHPTREASLSLGFPLHLLQPVALAKTDLGPPCGGAWGLGLGAWGLGLGAWGLGLGAWGLGLGVWGLGFGVWGLGFGVSSFEFRV